MPSPMEKFRWNARAARYVEQRTGRFVRGVTIRDAVDEALVVQRNRMLAATNRMRAGRMTLSQWHGEMRTALKRTHLYSAAAAKGGWAQLSRADYGRVGNVVKRQYGFLDNLAQGLESGRVPLDGRVLTRVGMYGMSGRETFHLVEREDKRDAGYQWEENILSAAENCSGCIEESDRGKVPIGELTPLGERVCRSNCKCSVRYS